MEKNIDHYMRLPYTVELERRGGWYRAWVRELPGCTAGAGANEGVGKLWERLEEAKRSWITQELEFGRRVPEPATPDPFWERFPDGIGEEEVRSMLHRRGAVAFPLRVLGRLWLRELEDEAAAQESGGTPRKEAAGRREGPERGTPEGDARSVRLGESDKVAWVGFDGPRTELGYRAVEVLDQPPRTEGAVVAALTVLEASVVRDADFERMRRALLGRADAPDGFGGKDLQEVLAKLPEKWFSAQKAAVNAEEAQSSKKLSGLEAKIPPKRPFKVESAEAREKRDKALKEYGKALKEHNRRFGQQAWERWERNPTLWKRTLAYTVALLRHRRSGFDVLPLEEQLGLLDGHRKRINRFLKEQRRHAAFLEYGTPKGLPKAVLNARNQVEAAVLADVAGLGPLDIATELGLDLSAEDKERYKGNKKIPKVTALVRDGRLLLEEVSGEEGWRRKAEGMKAEAARYESLSEEGKKTEALVDALAETMGWTAEEARTLCLRDPETARFLAWPTYP